jgi:CubicO group peptidase (beta-lactamase class C family)
MRRDSLFRITSMTKPVTAVAAMILVEECKLRLDDPVDPFLPELADRRVLRRIDGPLDDTVPAHRTITLRDLLTFRMGYGLILAPPDSYPIQRAERELELMTGPPLPRTPHNPDEWLRRLGTLPLLQQPGEQWLYNTGSDVLGVLIARAAGQPLEEFFRERIFEPLGMRDTSFAVPVGKLDRLADCYLFNPDTSTLELHDAAADSAWSRPPAFPRGADGLVSTIDDYYAFGRMLLNQGRHGDTRILARPTVELMATDQLTPGQRANAGPILGDNRGWGFGVSVVLTRDDIAASPGRFGWDGGYGTSWASDPREDLVGILMIQRPAFPNSPGLGVDFWTATYQAIDDEGAL